MDRKVYKFYGVFLILGILLCVNPGENCTSAVKLTACNNLCSDISITSGTENTGEVSKAKDIFNAVEMLFTLILISVYNVS